MVRQFVFHTLINRAIFGETLKEMDIKNSQCRLWFLLSFKEWKKIFLESELSSIIDDVKILKNLRGTRAVVDRVVFYCKVLNDLTSFLW